jgi:NAD(P)-dependent dehydrogenase (short-subunit alcohol dehydrogenase family)
VSVLEGATVVVIGGSSGIGLATAQAAGDAGAEVVVTGRSADRLRDAAAVLGHGVRTVALGSVDEDGTMALFDGLERVDHVFVAAATIGGGGLTPTTDEMRPLIETRLWGSVFAAKYAAPRMTQGGSITFCSGSSALRPRVGGSPVAAASAAAVEALARSLAVELAPIRVNTIVPGLVDTPLLNIAGDQRERFFERAAASLPVRRVGQPEDLAHAVVFLMENGYVTGITLTVDGGRAIV